MRPGVLSPRGRFAGVAAALASAALFFLAEPPVGLHVLLWIALVPLLLAAWAAQTPREAAGIGALFGAVCYGVFFRWVLHGWLYQLPVLYAMAFVIGTAFGAAFALGLRLLRRVPAWALAPVAAALWSTPFLLADNPWHPFLDSVILLTGINAPLPLPFLQLARPFGEAGLGAFVVLVNALLALAWRERAAARRAGTAGAAAAGLLAAAWVWGAARVLRMEAPRLPGPTFRLACAQQDLPFLWTWRAGHDAEIRATYAAMTEEAAAKGAGMVLFPQYELPEDAQRHPEYWSALAKDNRVTLAFGTYTPLVAMAPGKLAWVVSLVFGPDGRLLGAHRAMHPSPLGRPMVVPGPDPTPIAVPGLGRVAFLPCYDDVAPRVARLSAAAGATLLADIANDGPFLGTSQPALHLMRSRMRAIETGLPVVHCTPNGISAVIDPAGRVLQSLPSGRGLLIHDFASAAPADAREEK